MGDGWSDLQEIEQMVTDAERSWTGNPPSELRKRFVQEYKPVGDTSGQQVPTSDVQRWRRYCDEFRANPEKFRS